LPIRLQVVEGSVKQPIPFGKYLLLERINVGGMAEIFRAMAYGAEGFEKLVAIKRMLPHLSSDHQFVDMFVNEAKLAANLNHVNIVPIYDFGCIDNMLFLSMEYVHGKDISEITRKIKSRRLHTPVELACHIFIEV
jgi:serine/threonine protein kinase